MKYEAPPEPPYASFHTSPTSELSSAGFHRIISVQHSHQHPSPVGLPEILPTPLGRAHLCMPSWERFSRCQAICGPKTYAPFITWEQSGSFFWLYRSKRYSCNRLYATTDRHTHPAAKLKDFWLRQKSAFYSLLKDN